MTKTALANKMSISTFLKSKREREREGGGGSLGGGGGERERKLLISFES